jgi:hypothetical protein
MVLLFTVARPLKRICHQRQRHFLELAKRRCMRHGAEAYATP